MTITESAPPRVGAVGRARRSVQAVEKLAEIRREGRRVATDAEREVLAGWSGWGPLAPVFAPKDDTWVGLAERLRAVLSADELDLGSRGTYNAFYTPEPVARAMWEILLGLGFTGGRVLEPGCGGGVFMGTAPDTAMMTGVERDTTAADICRLLHPQARVITAELQAARLMGDFAAVIGNVPFADIGIFDPSAPRGATGSLHDYFIWRAVDLLAPGGVAVLLTSRYTMDKAETAARDAIASRADLVRAFRLPNGALAGGTDVVADVLVLRRRTSTPGRGLDWREITRERFDWWTPTSRYWQERPGDVLGEMRQGRTTQYGLTIEVTPRPGDPSPAEQLTAAAAVVAADARERGLLWQPPVDVAAPPDTTGLVTEEGWHDGSVRIVDDAVLRVEGGRLVPVERPSRELRELLRLRDLAVQLIEYEADHSMGDRLIDPLRAEVARLYADYVGRYGALNRCTLIEGKPDEETGLPTYTRRVPPMGGFRKDPDAALVFALEVFDDETGAAGPAPILSTRQNLPVRHPTRTSDPKQALAWSLNYRAGKVDLDYIAGVLGVADPADVPALLGQDVYLDPETRVWVTAEEYLSGNVRVKLAVAELAAATLPQFTRNVTALTAVLPPWLGPGEIVVNLGAPWISAADVAVFIHQTLGRRATVRRIPATGQWEVEVNASARETAAATADWGTFDVDAYTLIQLALNGRVPIVYRKVGTGADAKQHKDPDASMLANQKQQQLRERFAEWVWEDPERTDRLVHRYNTKYNTLAARTFSGEHITVDGLAPWFAAKVYPHQKQFVARAIATPAALCGHPVGAGKTATMAMTAMKLRQLGLVRKPMVVVPNHLIEQIDREFRQLFPGARILSAPAATIAANRRLFNARVATQEWDIILVTHSAFDRMGVSPQTEAAYIRQQVIDLEEAIRSASPDGHLEGRMVKALAKRKDALREQLAELKTRELGFDLGLTFESMGVDYILLDEAHYYKNLAVPVRTDGFSVRPSKRATGLEIKLRWLAQRGSGRYAALFTGTPVSNTMLEQYVVLRYLMQDYLRDIELGNADAWAATFVQFTTSVDVTVDGGQFQLVTRPSLFVNAPELRMLISQVADIRTATQLGLKRPKSIVETVACGRTKVQAEYSTRLVARAEHVKGRGYRLDPDDTDDTDNMLAICGDGRRMATDPALVGLRDPEPGKLAAVAANMLRIWREDPTCLQIGFCDVGTPSDSKGSQTYGRLRRLLTDGGMPVGLIRFVHNAKSDGDRAQLFADCRADGKIAVILGSTDKLGVGTNIQRRVKAMHHVDAPWRPADVEQREGRGLRPGNRYDLVRIFRYVVERTFDAYTWQLLTRKIGFISQIMSGKVDRTVEDISADVVDAYAAVKAVAAGQPLLLEKSKVEVEVKRLRAVKRGHQSTVDRLNRDIDRRRTEIASSTREAAAWEAIAAAAGDVADLDESEAARLHEFVQAFRRYSWHSDPGRFAGVQITMGTWRTRGDKPETHPLLNIRGGPAADGIELSGYVFWTPERLAGAFVDLLRGAPGKARRLRDEVARLEQANEEAAVSAARPFTDGDRLTAALARLDQIEAELHAAALRNEQDQTPTLPPTGPAPVEPMPDWTPGGQPDEEDTEDTDDEPADDAGRTASGDDPDDDLGGLLGEMMDEYDQFTRDVLADLMSD